MHTEFKRCTSSPPLHTHAHARTRTRIHTYTHTCVHTSLKIGSRACAKICDNAVVSKCSHFCDLCYAVLYGGAKPHTPTFPFAGVPYQFCVYLPREVWDWGHDISCMAWLVSWLGAWSTAMRRWWQLHDSKGHTWRRQSYAHSRTCSDMSSFSANSW